jgi:hypothetical protein
MPVAERNVNALFLATILPKNRGIQKIEYNATAQGMNVKRSQD